MTSRYERVRAIFDEVVDLDEPDRSTAIERLVGGDLALRNDVAELLTHDARATSFLGTRDGTLRALVDELSTHALPAIDGFTVERCLGAGASSVVFLAQQHFPERTVAIKVIRTFGGDRRVWSRFEIESEALARLNHPHIAAVHEAGVHRTATDAHPYLVMEYVEGVSIAAFARDCTLVERVELVATIAAAVHHAHQHGVVHRDLKPSNILVDRDGRPRILDFGLARLVDHDTAATQERTLDGTVLGTVRYMSPEQARGERDAIDVRSDVYSLGVVAYELLYDQRAITPEHASFPAELAAIEAGPRAAPPRRELPDLSVVIDRALEPARDARYQSAGAFADDLRHARRLEPVTARRRSSWYLLRRYARRHRARTATGIVALVAAFVVAATLVNSAVQTRRQNERLSRLLAAIDNQILGGDSLEIALVERGRDWWRAEGGGLRAELFRGGGIRPEDEAYLAALLGRQLFSESRFRAALEPLEHARRLCGTHLPPEHETTLRVLEQIGRCHAALGEYDRALAHYEMVRERATGRAPEMHLLALCRLALLDPSGDPERAARYLDEVMPIVRERAGETSYLMSRCRARRACVTCLQQGPQAAIEPLFVIADTFPAGAVRDDLLDSAASFIGTWSSGRGHLDDAERVLRRALDEMTEPRLRTTLRLGGVLIAQGRTEEALPPLRRAVAIARAELPEFHPKRALAEKALAVALRRLGRLDEAERLMRGVLHAVRETYGVETARGLRARITLARVLLTRTEAEAWAEARELARAAERTARRLFPLGGTDRMETAAALAVAARRLGEIDGAAAAAQRAAAERSVGRASRAAWNDTGRWVFEVLLEFSDDPAVMIEQERAALANAEHLIPEQRAMLDAWLDELADVR